MPTAARTRRSRPACWSDWSPICAASSRALSPGAESLRRADLLLQLGRALVRLERQSEAWDAAREAFDLYMAEQAWEGAAQACDILFLADQPDSLPALGQGIWLAVTYPVDPELSVALLQHVVDETPPEADGAAVAAVTAFYLVDLRARDPQREHLLIYANQLLATVARRHSGVDGQQAFDKWIEDMELNDPDAIPAAPAQRRRRAGPGRLVVRPRGPAGRAADDVGE